MAHLTSINSIILQCIDSEYKIFIYVVIINNILVYTDHECQLKLIMCAVVY